MASDADLVREMQQQLEAQNRRLAELEADNEALKSARDQVAHCAPGITMESGRAKAPCGLCRNHHRPGQECHVCRECRRPKGEEYRSNAMIPPCSVCGSHPVSDDALRARGHYIPRS